MRIGFVVNDVQTEEPAFTTTRLAMTAVNLGHESWMLGVGDFIYSADGSVRANARAGTAKEYDSLDDYLREVQGDEARCEQITVDDLDVLLLRNDPSTDAGKAWAQTAGILFGQLGQAQKLNQY